ncbi:MAG: thioester-forming surface-anchored protein [Actinomycetaceae bacterium]|nr:thioester-forming surface-anchored protein [Actinomycetaceae bacterium]
MSEGTAVRLRQEDERGVIVNRVKPSGRLWSLATVFVLIFSGLGVVCVGGAHAIPGETGDVYRAYTVASPDTANTNIYVYPDGDKSHPIVAYCFNIHKQWPATSQSYMADKNFYLHKDVSGVASFADTPRREGPDGAELTPAAFDNAVLRVILNGYPNNSALQAKYGLSDEEFRMITQEAFHYYADNTNAPSKITAKNVYVKVYDILVGKVADDAMRPVPDNAVINILEYDPDGRFNFQNLITVDFRLFAGEEPAMLNVKFSKVAAGQGEELAGATLSVTGGDHVSEKWVSTGEAKVLTLGAGEYTLKETAAPEGYLIANEIDFRVTEEGALEVKGADGAYAPANDAQVRMVDKPAPAVEPTPKPGTSEPETPESETPETPKSDVPRPETPEPEPTEPETSGSQTPKPATPQPRTSAPSKPVKSLAKTGATVGRLAIVSLALTAVGGLLVRRRQDI